MKRDEERKKCGGKSRKECKGRERKGKEDIV